MVFENGKCRTAEYNPIIPLLVGKSSYYKTKGASALAEAPLQYLRPESNRHARNGHRILSPARLPIPPLRHLLTLYKKSRFTIGTLSGKRDSNSRPRPWQGRALPTELFPRFGFAIAKVRTFFNLPKFFEEIFKKFSPRRQTNYITVSNSLRNLTSFSK